MIKDLHDITIELFDKTTTHFSCEDIETILAILTIDFSNAKLKDVEAIESFIKNKLDIFDDEFIHEVILNLRFCHFSTIDVNCQVEEQKTSYERERERSILLYFPDDIKVTSTEKVFLNNYRKDYIKYDNESFSYMLKRFDCQLVFERATQEENKKRVEEKIKLEKKKERRIHVYPAKVFSYLLTIGLIIISMAVSDSADFFYYISQFFAAIGFIFYGIGSLYLGTKLAEKMDDNFIDYVYYWSLSLLAFILMQKFIFGGE